MSKSWIDTIRLQRAAEIGDENEVRAALDAGADIHVHDEWPLFIAARGGYESVVRLLLDRGADIHAHNDWALTWAAWGGHEAVVCLLLDRGANVGAVALELVAKGGHKAVFKLLKEHMENLAASAEPRNNDGRDYCFWCGEPTREFGMRFGRICTACGR